MDEKSSLLEGLKVEIDQEQATQVVNVRSIAPTSEKIEELEKVSPEFKGIKDTIRRLKIYLEGCLLFEGTIRVGDKELPFVNLVRSGEKEQDIREAVNIIFSPREGHRSYIRYKSAGKMVERYRDVCLAKSSTLRIHEDGIIEKDEDEICDGKDRTIEISNDASIERKRYQNLIPGYNAKSYPEGRVIANSIEWDDGGKYSKYVKYALVYSNGEAKSPVEILENEDDVYSVYVLGNNGKFEKVVREKCSERGESCESQTLDEYLKGMKEKYGIEPVTAKDRDISFSDLSKYSIPEEIKKIVEACYQLRMKQKGENNISK